MNHEFSSFSLLALLPVSLLLLLLLVLLSPFMHGILLLALFGL